MKKLSKINENTWVDIIKKDREDYVKKEDFLIKDIDKLKKEIKEIINQTTGKVLNLRNLGRRISNINQLKHLFIDNYTTILPETIKEIDVTGWKISESGVIDICGLFVGCLNIKKIIGLETWDVSGVTNMMGVFNCCENITELNISNWDVSGVKNMRGMFSACYNLKELDLNNWDVSGVENMDAMFDNCENLTELNISNWDVNGVIDMSYMFRNCHKLNLTELNIDKWNVNEFKCDISFMFNGCGCDSADSTLEDDELPSWYISILKK